MVDFIGKVENIENDYFLIANKLGLSLSALNHLNNSVNDNSYLNYYNSEKDIEHVRNIYSLDFDLLKLPIPFGQVHFITL